MKPFIEAIEFKGIEALRLNGPRGSSAIVARLGGQVLSWITPDGREHLFLSERAVFDGSAPIRGGIPVCFPQFGGLGDLPKHGFARTREWTVAGQRCADDYALATLELADDQDGGGEKRAEAIASLSGMYHDMAAAPHIADWIAKAESEALDESVALLNRLLEREPGNATLLHFRGEARRQRAADGDAALALADFDAAVQTGVEPLVTYRSLGYLYRALHRTDEARTAWRRYLEQAPDAPDADLIKQTLEEMKS